MIKVRNLSKSYGDIKAVNDISFDVQKGEVYAFLGENGAGKSTTINIICTILKKDKGEVIINGHHLDKADDKIKKDIGVVFQGSYLDDTLTIYENLFARAMLYGFTTKQAKEQIKWVSEQLRLEEFIKRRYNKISGGQRRRADIARAILHKPKLLILDEPTTGLDPATRAMVWETIQSLKKEAEMTIFFSTHYMEEAENANRISIIKNGIIAVTDTPYVLKQKYSYDSLNLYGEMDKIKEYLEKNNFVYATNNDYIIVKLKQSMLAIDIINAIKTDITSFEVEKGNMDTVFLTITGNDDFENWGAKNE